MSNLFSFAVIQLWLSKMQRIVKLPEESVGFTEVLIAMETTSYDSKMNSLWVTIKVNSMESLHYG